MEKEMALSQRLKALRDRLGLTLQEVYDKTGIVPSSLSDFENGKREPSLSQLQKLAEVYEQPISALFEDAPAEEAALLWRNKPDAPVSDRIQAKFERLCKQYRNLETWTSEVAEESFKKLFAEVFPVDYPAVERLAHEVGGKMGLGERPGESLLRVIEEVYGVKVFHLDLGCETSSACIYSERYGPAILLNRGNKPWRRNFDLAHELFHLITWKARAAAQDTWTMPGEREESFANVFASRLLMPDEPFRDAIEAVMREGKATYDDLDSVARQFGVSLDALFWRLSSLYRIKAEDTRAMIEQAKIFSKLPPRPDDLPSEFPHRYQALAVKALRHGEISSAQFANYLGMNISEVDEYTANVPEPVQIAAGHP
jgi:Zn-dependent peptidase ImmA (M78 family)/transcriptional regulator with XRE-family HTH domain